MGRLARVGDSLRNLVANLGTSRDKAAGSYYATPVLTENEAIDAYRGSWLARKLTDIPAKDATRRWRSWNAEDVEISKLEAEENRLGLRVKVLDALTKARLTGGAAIYIGTGDNDPTKPLDAERIGAGGIRHLIVLSKRLLQAGELELDPESPYFGRPKVYTLTAQTRQVDIHPSRLVVFVGNPLPDTELIAGASQGWGDSILLAILQALKNADSTTANIASLVFEAKIDVIKIPGFMANLAGGSEEYTNQVLERLTLAATAKGINGALILDKDEEYDTKQVNFAQLPEILQMFLQIVSGAADIPVTRLLGQSPGGLNASGESDLRNYYDHIQSMQELSIGPAMELLDECLIRSALGTRPPELWYGWRSLWQTTDKERADIGKTTADTIKTIADTKLLPEEVMTKVATNMLTEAGVAPGLESELADWLKANPDGLEGSEEEDLAAVTPPAGDVGEITDAMPRPLYIQRKVLNAQAIVDWAKAQGFETTLPAEDMHVTIAFSRAPVDWMKVGQPWNDDERGRMRIKPGGARLIEKFEGGAVVLQFASSELSWRHESIKEAGASWDWPDYQPHITLTYDAGDVDLADVQPYTGPIELGPEIFEALDEDWKNRVREE